MKFKKLISCALSAAMLMTAGIMPIAARAEESFAYDMTDVKPDGENGVVFETELTNGDYTVTVKTGGDTETSANIYINGGERVRAYTLEAGKSQDNVQPVVITDGKLKVQILGENPNVTEIVIDPIAPRTEAGDIPTIYIAGDSTAQTYDYAKVYPQTGWGQVFEDYFIPNSVHVENRSMGGRSSKSYNNDGRLDKILTELKPGDYVFIQFGINDGAENKPERYISVEDYKTLIKDKYIGETIKRGGIPVLMTATSAAWWDEENNCFMESRADYADPTRELAAETGVTFIDANRIITDTWNAMGKNEVLSGYFICEPLESMAYPTGTDDHTHLKAKGAKKIAELIAAEAKNKIPELAKYVKDDEKFMDINGHWGETYITALANKGLIEGDGNGHFNPDGTVTRAEFLKMAMEASDIPGHGYREGECLDATIDDWYCHYLQGALDKDLIPVAFIKGSSYPTTKILAEATEDKEAVTAEIKTYLGNFNGNTPITREEMAVIAMNCLSYRLKNAEEPIEFEPYQTDGAGFVDSDIYEEYINSVDAAYSIGLVQGMGDGRFAPKAHLTRAQAAAIVLRLSNLLK